MMGYLQPAEYAVYGLPAETADAWVTTASAMMEAHCRRPSLLPTSYTERFRPGGRSQAVQLSYGPLVSVDSVRGLYGRQAGSQGSELLGYVAEVFGLPGQWTPVDGAALELFPTTGEVQFLPGLFGLPFAEVEVTYTAGLVTMPAAVKVACAQIVRNAQATPGLNVRSSRMDTLQTEYFSDVLLDSQVRAMLRPYVAERLG